MCRSLLGRSGRKGDSGSRNHIGKFRGAGQVCLGE